MAHSSASRAPSGITTIAAISTVIGVAFTIWIWYLRPTTQLQATVEYGTYLVDPWTAAAMSTNSKKLDEIRRELNDYLIAGAKLSVPLKKYADDAFRSFNSSLIRSDSNQTYGYIRTVISNHGDLGAKDVALRLPNAVGSLVTFDDGTQKVFGTSPTIELGDLKSEQKVTVYSWLLSTPTFYLGADSNISLTYAGGKGDVEIPGKHSLIYETLTSTPMKIFYLFIGFWLLVGVRQWGFQQGLNQRKFQLDLSPPHRDVNDSE